MKALVTGGCGFLGSHMVEFLLEKKIDVKVIDNLSNGNKSNIDFGGKSNVEFLEADITQPKDYINFIKDVQFVYHFAGKGEIIPSITNPIEYFQTNFNGTVILLNQVKEINLKKFVYAASSSCYGENPDVPTTETNEILISHPYALSKYMGEKGGLEFSRIYGIPFNSIRIFNAYGPRSRTSGNYGAVFGVFLKQFLSGAPLTIVGDGEQKRDFVFCKDVVNAFYLAATSDYKYEIWNLGSSKPISINELANLISNLRVNIPDRPGEPKITHADITKITKELQWKPKVSFDEGVSLILENLSHWESAPLWTQEKIAVETKKWFDIFTSKK